MNPAATTESEPPRSAAGAGPAPTTGAAPAALEGGLAERLRRWLPWVAGLLVALCWDRAVYLHVRVADPNKAAAMKEAGWYQALRTLGTLYPWLAVGVLLVIIDASARKGRDMLRRGVFLFLCPLLAGGVAEVLKPLVGRYKPDVTNGWYGFAALRERVAWNDLGMASSHTSVAFAGAFALSYLVPRGAPFFVAGAVGCALTRLLAGAHYFSDVYVGVVIAYAAVRAVYVLDRGRNAGIPIAGGAL